ncbi:MAG: hypothetical protein ABIU05_07380 [Nitrospirales bacterium]
MKDDTLIAIANLIATSLAKQVVAVLTELLRRQSTLKRELVVTAEKPLKSRGEHEPL